MLVELTRLKIFREVAVLGSFTKAAEVLGYAQPSVSHHIAQLERELGAQLFERQPPRIRLTPAGQVFLGHVQSVLVRLTDAQREVAETARAGAGVLRIAAFPTAAATLIPAAAGAFRAQRPDAEHGDGVREAAVVQPVACHSRASSARQSKPGAAPDVLRALEAASHDECRAALRTDGRRGL